MKIDMKKNRLMDQIWYRRTMLKNGVHTMRPKTLILPSDILTLYIYEYNLNITGRK